MSRNHYFFKRAITSKIILWVKIKNVMTQSGLTLSNIQTNRSLMSCTDDIFMSVYSTCVGVCMHICIYCITYSQVLTYYSTNNNNYYY